MTLFACQTYVQGLLYGLPVPGYQQPTVSYVKPPIPGLMDMTRPFVFVWGGLADESRIAIPRETAPGVPAGSPGGWKKAQRTISIWLYGIELANLQGPSPFPTAIETVMQALRSANPMPAELTDPASGQVSQLFDLGENLSFEYDVDRSLADQQTVRNLCHIEAPVQENFQS